MNKELKSIDLHNKEDLKQILEIAQTLKSSPTPVTDTMKHLKECTYQKGIYINNQLVAFILVSENENKEGHICNLATHPDFTQQGFAKELMEDVMKEFNELKLDALENNEVAYKLYKNLGFLETRLYYDLLQNKIYEMEWHKLKIKRKAILTKNKKLLGI